MVTGRFDEARALLMAFASCVRHGLVPNLLDRSVFPVPAKAVVRFCLGPRSRPGLCVRRIDPSARFARYNCRDAVWWWLQAVQDYVALSPESTNFLKVSVVRYYPQDDVSDPTYTSEAYGPPRAHLRASSVGG